MSLEDLKAFVRLRYEALDMEPFAFAGSIEDSPHLASASFVRQSLTREEGRAIVGAFAPELVGVAGIYRDRPRKTAHKAHIWGMYVRAGHRGAGVGELLLAAAIRHASSIDGVMQVHLTVSEAAGAARRLYERHGFELWGTEPKALNHRGQMVAEHHLVLLLDRSYPEHLKCEFRIPG